MLFCFYGQAEMQDLWGEDKPVTTKLFPVSRWFPAVCMAVMLASGPACSQTGGRVEVEARLNRESVPLNQTAWLTLTVRWNGATDEVEVPAPPDPKFDNATVTASRTSNEATVAGSQPRTIRRYEFRLKPQGMGMAYVQPVSVAYRVKGETSLQTLTTNRLSLKVLAAEEVGAPLWVRLGILVFVAFALVGLLAFLLKRNASGEETSEEDAEETKVSPVEDLRREWLEIETASGTQELQRSLFVQATQVMRKAIALRLGALLKTATPGTVTSELIHPEAPEEMVTHVHEILALADRIKFANYDPPRDELAEAWRSVRRVMGYLMNKITEEKEEKNE
ncbi:MAG: hypothetical protein HY318_02440 [Armatimonadetes bacterium]|nr:hypothetical protein [Armatimonadota bacterium]